LLLWWAIRELECHTRFASLLICTFQGAIQNDRSLVEAGYNQVADYYDILYDNEAGMMKHILLGDPGVQDHNHWASGNGWAVNGMLRVLRIIQLSNFASGMGTEQANLLQWASTVSLAC
jgi:rhamnogalacturonyl hydrolase YesR